MTLVFIGRPRAVMAITTLPRASMVINVPIRGPKGDVGSAGQPGPAAITEQYFFAGPISFIGQAHGLGRTPAVSVFLNNELVGIGISATSTSVVIEFPFSVYNVRIILT